MSGALSTQAERLDRLCIIPINEEGAETDWKKLLPPEGFQVLPRRWVVERTFSWIEKNRRMSKDYQRLSASSEAFVYAAMSRLMVRRLIRV